MKKIFCLAIAVLVFSAGSAFAKCTPEEFAKHVAETQSLLMELAKDEAKVQRVNAELEKLFSDDLKELEALSMKQAQGQTLEGQQEILDKGCSLYSKMNAKIKELQ